MNDHANLGDSTTAGIDDCWNRIGVKGDGTCGELKAVFHCRNCPVFAAAGQRLFEGPPPDTYLDEQTRQIREEEGDADVVGQGGPVERDGYAHRTDGTTGQSGELVPIPPTDRERATPLPPPDSGQTLGFEDPRQVKKEEPTPK